MAIPFKTPEVEAYLGAGEAADRIAVGKHIDGSVPAGSIPKERERTRPVMIRSGRRG
jgi:hypothetical protein